MPPTPIKVPRTWSRGGAGVVIPDAKHPNVRVILENMQLEIDNLKAGLVIATPDGSNAGTTQTLANAIKAALNAAAAQAALVVFPEPTPVTAQY